MKTEHSLGPVEGDDGFFIPGLSGGLDLVYEVGEDLTGEITASPVEREFSAFFGGLEGAFVDVFQLGKGQLFRGSRSGFRPGRWGQERSVVHGHERCFCHPG